MKCNEIGKWEAYSHRAGFLLKARNHGDTSHIHSWKITLNLRTEETRRRRAINHNIGGLSLYLFRPGSRAGNRSPAENVFVRAVIVKDAAVTAVPRPSTYLLWT
jgi:hypothetical protein